MGDGGPPLGNFPHIIPFFSDHVPNSNEERFLALKVILQTESECNKSEIELK